MDRLTGQEPKEMTLRRAGSLAAIPLFGAGAAAGTSLLAMGCCLGPAILTTALTAAGLGTFLSLDLGVLVPILYALVGLSLVAIAWSCWRSRRWFPLALAALGAGALLLPFHEALDVGLFYALVIGGQVSLLAAAGLAAWAATTRGKSCPSQWSRGCESWARPVATASSGGGRECAEEAVGRRARSE